MNRDATFPPPYQVPTSPSERDLLNSAHEANTEEEEEQEEEDTLSSALNRRGQIRKVIFLAGTLALVAFMAVVRAQHPADSTVPGARPPVQLTQQAGGDVVLAASAR